MWNRSETEQAWPVDVVTPLDGLRKAWKGEAHELQLGGISKSPGISI